MSYFLLVWLASCYFFIKNIFFHFILVLAIDIKPSKKWSILNAVSFF